jgi:hypothetical protein
MKPVLILAALLACPGASPDEQRQERLMDEIESRIELPPGAAPLDRYARHYGLDRNGKIAGQYNIPHRPDPGDGCEELLDNGDSREVPCNPIDGLAAGRRLWVGDARNLRIAFHGGCSVVGLRFDPATKTFDWVACNDRH